MEKNYLENNSLTLIGKITDDKTFSHEIYSEKFYTVNVSVPRLSGNADLIPVTISERLFKDSDLTIGRNIKVEGQFRSYNSYEKEKNRLILTVFAKSIEFIEDEIDNIESTQGIATNEVELIGYICKPPIYRQTPFGREIADVLLAVNRVYVKSDYLPCIAWGRNAKFAENNLEVGDKAKIVGRFQSREYVKKNGEKEEKKVAYEISLSSIEKIKEEVEVEVKEEA